MCPEELKSQIQLIFAQACADGLKEMAQQILDLKDPDREAAAKAYGEAFASAFISVSRHFISAAGLSSTLAAEAHTAQSNSTAGAGLQQPADAQAEALERLLQKQPRAT